MKQLMSPEMDAVSMQYHCDFDDRGNVTLNVRRTRLVKRSRNYQWEGVVHEDLAVNGGIIYDSDIVVTHRKNHTTTDPDRNLLIYETSFVYRQGIYFKRYVALRYGTPSAPSVPKGRRVLSQSYEYGEEPQQKTASMPVPNWRIVITTLGTEKRNVRLYSILLNTILLARSFVVVWAITSWRKANFFKLRSGTN